MTAQEKKYNGWANYETWNVTLWMSNEEPPYRDIVQSLRSGKFTPESARRMFGEWFPGGTPDMQSRDTDISNVDWQEVADAWNEYDD